ncbi:MAG: alpha/beta fold hydrolase, partial [Streptosporangiaceae bacterium]
AQELTLLSRPWGFQNSDISTPVHLWHGALDTNVPISAAHRLARELPRASTHFSDTAGHSVGYERRHEVMALLAAPD